MSAAITIPRPMTDVAALLLAAMKRENETPVKWEIVYGEGAIEDLAEAGVLRSIANVARLFDLPVETPERPGPRPFVVEMTLLGEYVGMNAGIEVGLLLSCTD